MKLEKERSIILAIFMLGFLLGIIYSNVVAESYVTITNIFHENYLNQYLQIKTVTTDYLFYLLRYRLVSFLAISILAATKYKKIAGICFLAWTGFSAGVLAVTSVLSIGAFGMVVCLAALFPHFLFYIVSYLILLFYCIGGLKVEWNPVKTVAVIVFQIVGIVLECYINPWVMKFIISIIL